MGKAVRRYQWRWSSQRRTLRSPPRTGSTDSSASGQPGAQRWYDHGQCGGLHPDLLRRYSHQLPFRTGVPFQWRSSRDGSNGEHARAGISTGFLLDKPSGRVFISRCRHDAHLGFGIWSRGASRQQKLHTSSNERHKLQVWGGDVLLTVCSKDRSAVQADHRLRDTGASRAAVEESSHLHRPRNHDHMTKKAQ